MISDEELASLPQGNEAAFVQLVDILNRELVNGDEEGWRFRAQQYVQVLLAFIDEHDLQAGMGFSVDRDMPGADTNGFYDWFTTFRNTINYYQARYRFRQRVTVGDAITIRINADIRQEIHALLSKIRKVVANLQVSDRKRAAIYDKISKLAAEVDKDRTKIDLLMDFILEASGVAGEAAENLEPVVKLAERLRDLFAKAQTENRPALPGTGEGKQARIPGPAVPQEATSSHPGGGAIDDDIPF